MFIPRPLSPIWFKFPLENLKWIALVFYVLLNMATWLYLSQTELACRVSFGFLRTRGRAGFVGSLSLSPTKESLWDAWDWYHIHLILVQESVLEPWDWYLVKAYIWFWSWKTRKCYPIPFMMLGQIWAPKSPLHCPRCPYCRWFPIKNL